MDWISTVVTAVCAIVGAFGGGSILYFQQTRKQKEIDNELKEAQEWEKLYREVATQNKEKDNKIEELRRDINNLREGKITLVEENAAKVQELLAEQSSLEIQLAVAKWNNCEVIGCMKRRPPRKENKNENYD